LRTPSGTIDASNLGQFGSVDYTDTILTVDGRVIPPNTFYFRLTGFQTGSPDVKMPFTLSLGSLPRDLEGREILSSRPAASFVDWSFYPFAGQGIPGAEVPSNVVANVVFEASACNGPTNADLTPIPSPSFQQGDITPNSFSLEYYSVPLPFRIPSTERRFSLLLRDPDTIQPGDVYTFPAPQEELFSLYEDLDYVDNDGGFVARSFRAVSGTVTVISIQSGRIELLVDAVYSSDSEFSPPENEGTGSFCLRAPIVVNFP
jgi:hypothetical protein